MSQKAGKRSRRLTDDDNTAQFKLPTAKNVKEVKEDHETATTGTNQEEIANNRNEINGNETITTTIVEVEKSERVTRSRSNTPQIKQMINGKEDNEKQEQQQESSTSSSSYVQLQEEIIIEEIIEKTDEMCEMDPLVLDEPDPELVFDENSDHDGASGKSSPILNRCVTRRSQTRNIPTPKTPTQPQSQQSQHKEVEDDRESSSQAPPSSSGGGDGGGDDLSSTFETCDNLSTKAETGSDATRFDYLLNNTTKIAVDLTLPSEPSSFLLESKDRSFTETLRNLSTRRSIRPMYDYRRQIHNKNALNQSAPIYPTRRQSVERVSVGCNKRKFDDDVDNTSLKRFKLDTSGIWTKLTSPLTNLKSFKRSDLPSSTPILTGYKDEKLYVDDNGQKDEIIDTNEKRWCVIM